jgi:hypothetical protein
MDKKEIYEHLAKIYLDASNNKRRKKLRPVLNKGPLVLSICAALGLAVILLTQNRRHSLLNSEVSLVLQPDLTRINFHFDPAKKEIYSLGLNRLSLSRYKLLAFSAKTSDYNLRAYLRIEFTNSYKEKSEIYLKDISHKWREYKIPLVEFKKISDWSEMTNLAFIVEEWNTKDKQGVVYIDNVAVLR